MIKPKKQRDCEIKMRCEIDVEREMYLMYQSRAVIIKMQVRERGKKRERKKKDGNLIESVHALSPAFVSELLPGFINLQLHSRQEKTSLTKVRL